MKNEVGGITINDVNASIEGDLHDEDNYNEIRNQIQIKSWLGNYGKVDFFVDMKPQIEIEGQVYYTKSTTKAEEFENEFQLCFDFLDKAIELNQKVLWEIW